MRIGADVRCQLAEALSCDELVTSNMPKCWPTEAVARPSEGHSWSTSSSGISATGSRMAGQQQCIIAGHVERDPRRDRE